VHEHYRPPIMVDGEAAERLQGILVVWKTRMPRASMRPRQKLNTCPFWDSVGTKESRSPNWRRRFLALRVRVCQVSGTSSRRSRGWSSRSSIVSRCCSARRISRASPGGNSRSEEHTSELQSRFDLVCRLLLEKKTACTSASD